MSLHDLEEPDTARWTQHAEAEQREYSMMRQVKLDVACCNNVGNDDVTYQIGCRMPTTLSYTCAPCTFAQRC